MRESDGIDVESVSQVPCPYPFGTPFYGPLRRKGELLLSKVELDAVQAAFLASGNPFVRLCTLVAIASSDGVCAADSASHAFSPPCGLPEFSKLHSPSGSCCRDSVRTGSALSSPAGASDITEGGSRRRRAPSTHVVSVSHLSARVRQLQEELRLSEAKVCAAGTATSPLTRRMRRELVADQVKGNATPEVMLMTQESPNPEEDVEGCKPRKRPQKPSGPERAKPSRQAVKPSDDLPSVDQMERSNAKASNEPTCPKGHLLSHLGHAPDRRSLTCDRCLVKDLPMHSCRECDYDLCSKCAAVSPFVFGRRGQQARAKKCPQPKCPSTQAHPATGRGRGLAEKGKAERTDDLVARSSGTTGRGQKRSRKTADEQEHIVIESPISTASRGGGRSRKAAVERADAAATRSNRSASRGRGRQKAAAEQADPGTASPNRSASRGRGRPRKVPIEQPNLVIASRNKSASTGRGRPKKAAVQPEDPAVARPNRSASRGRGRQRKAIDEQADPVIASPVKKARVARPTCSTRSSGGGRASKGRAGSTGAPSGNVTREAVPTASACASTMDASMLPMITSAESTHAEGKKAVLLQTAVTSSSPLRDGGALPTASCAMTASANTVDSGKLDAECISNVAATSTAQQNLSAASRIDAVVNENVSSVAPLAPQERQQLLEMFNQLDDFQTDLLLDFLQLPPSSSEEDDVNIDIDSLSPARQHDLLTFVRSIACGQIACSSTSENNAAPTLDEAQLTFAPSQGAKSVVLVSDVQKTSITSCPSSAPPQEAARELTLEEKAALQTDFDSLDDTQLDSVMAFLGSHVASGEDAEDVEVDVASLPPRRQRELVEFVTAIKAQSQAIVGDPTCGQPIN